MAKKLLKNISYLVTMENNKADVLKDKAIIIENNFIEKILNNNEVKDFSNFEEVIDCKDHILLPGLINTHHHFYQTLTRNLPAVQNAELFDWLIYLYDIWAKITPEILYTASQIAAVELIMSGCTTAVDHFYVFPNNDNTYFDSELEAVKNTGLRFHLCRGSMSLSKKDGGLPPDSVVQCDESILKHSEEVINRYHDYNKYSMNRVILAPCSPFSVTGEIMKDTIKLGKEKNVFCHTHLAETKDEEDFCIELFGKRPFDYLESLGWITDNAFFAHTIWLNDDEIDRMAKAGAGSSHCPTSNMRLGSGIAPIVDMMAKGVKVSLAVDGSASNDSSHMMAELRNAMLLQRIRYGMKFTAEDAVKLGTVGGADVIGRPDDLGKIKENYAADIIGVNLNKIWYAGGLSDPLAALIFCMTPKVDLSIINGKKIIQNGKFLKFDIQPLIEKQNKFAMELLK